MKTNETSKQVVLGVVAAVVIGVASASTDLASSKKSDAETINNVFGTIIPIEGLPECTDGPRR